MIIPDRYDPWAWRPSRQAWYRSLENRVAAWQPPVALELDTARLMRRLKQAAEAGEAWLFHPSLNVLTAPWTHSLESHFQLVAWIALHSSQPLGSVRVPEPLWAWREDGGRSVDPGRYDLNELWAAVEGSEPPRSIALDVWCDSLGFSYPEDWNWKDRQPLSSVQEQRLKGEIVRFLRVIDLIFAKFPTCFAWIAAAVRVVIPLCRGEGDPSFKSGSRADLPGLVYFDLDGGVSQILEALVHECAHQHFFVAEATGAFVDPEHLVRYSSPLRPEPRPLRGIFLAYHALAHICSIFSDCFAGGSGDRHEEELHTSLRAKRNEAEGTLEASKRFFTEQGLEFFAETRKVAAYDHCF